MEFENSANPFFERKYTIEKWKRLSISDIEETDTILLKANYLVDLGLKAKDALHVACAIETNCNYFLTTDDLLLKKLKDISEINVMNPIGFINVIEKL